MDDDRPERVFGRRLRALREDKGWSLEDMAGQLAAVGVDWHRATINKVEVGRRGVSLSDALVIARALDVALADLLDASVQVGNATLTPDETARLCARHPVDEQWVSDHLAGFMDTVQRLIVADLITTIGHLDLVDLVELRKGRVPPALRELIDALTGDTRDESEQ